ASAVVTAETIPGTSWATKTSVGRAPFTSTAKPSISLIMIRPAPSEAPVTTAWCSSRRRVMRVVLGWCSPRSLVLLNLSRIPAAPEALGVGGDAQQPCGNGPVGAMPAAGPGEGAVQRHRGLLRVRPGEAAREESDPAGAGGM